MIVPDTRPFRLSTAHFDQLLQVTDGLWSVYDHARLAGITVKAFKLSPQDYKTYTDACHNWVDPIFNGVEVRKV